MCEPLMDISFIHTDAKQAFEKKSVGGAELQLYHISAKLAERGHNIKFLTRTDSKESIDKVELIPCLGDVDTIAKKIRVGLKMLIQMDKQDSDIYFTSSDNMTPGLVSLYCILKGKKHVHRTVHKREIDKQIIKNNPVKGIIHHLGLRSSDLIFVQCEEHEKMISDWFDPNTKIIRNSFVIGDKPKSEKNQILWVGRRVRWKNPSMFLDLAESRPSENFVMISPCTSGSEEFYSKIRKRSKDISNLKLIERVPREEIQEYFDKAKIFVNTSDKEGFPNTFIESGLGKTPILSYKVDPDSFIEKNSCGYSCNGEQELLENRLDEMLENKDRTLQQGSNCRKYVEKYHDLSNNILRIEESLKQVIED